MTTRQDDILDRFEIDALRGEFTDAASVGDFDRFAGLFTDDGRWAIPEAGVDLTGRAEIRAAIGRLQQVWEFFVQQAHPGTVRVDGDTATGRSYVYEAGRMRDGRSHLNYAIYHDEYRRTADGWRFTSRVYQVLYVDDSPLTGEARERPGDARRAG
jgi:uncharacterized protein (TIGR02246 family)